MFAKRKWVSSISNSNDSILNLLEEKMSDFYANERLNYYVEIDFTNTVWESELQLPQQDIIKIIQAADKVLEVGCGSSNILLNNKNIEKKYYGCDFSNELMLKNKNKYPDATFETITDPNKLPFHSESFDIVFSHFVIEHAVRPYFFLDECIRCLKPKGVLIVLCPDFLGRGNISSQVSGKNVGTGREKWIENKYVDSAITAFENKIRYPFWAFWHRLKLKIQKKPIFLINVFPKCFKEDYTYTPDYDAVYITSKWDIIYYTRDFINWQENSKQINEYCNLNKLIYLVGIKNE